MNVRVALCQQEIKCFIFKKHLLLMWWDLYYHASLVSPNQLSLMLFIGPGKKKKKLLHALHLTWDQEYILIITFQFKDLHRVILQDNGLDSLKSVGWPMWTNQVTLQTVTITPSRYWLKTLMNQTVNIFKGFNKYIVLQANNKTFNQMS